jgi:hypothetical protein
VGPKAGLEGYDKGKINLHWGSNPKLRAFSESVYRLRCPRSLVLRVRLQKSSPSNIYIYIYIYVCICVCLCACVYIWLSVGVANVGCDTFMYLRRNSCIMDTHNFVHKSVSFVI